MQDYEAINELKLESQENAILMEDVYNAKTTRKLKLYIPKIMSLGNKGTKNSTIIINTNKLLANDNLPNVFSRKVTVCNYIYVPLVANAFRGPYREDKYGRIHLHAGEKIICIVPNGNILDIKATDWGN